MRVLIVEDDRSVARFLRQAATEAGYTAEVAETGPEGLELASSSAFDLVLLDLTLPRMDGLDVCRQLRGAPREHADSDHHGPRYPRR